MDPSAPTPKAKIWFPWFKLTIFLVVVSTTMYFTLEAFNPHIERDPSEWQGPAKNPKIKQLEWMYKLLKSKPKK